MTRIALFDEGVRGHHLGFQQTLVDAALAGGHQVLAVTPERPAGAEVEWVPVPARSMRELRAGRRSLRIAVDAAVAFDAEVLCDLHLDKTALVLDSSILRVPQRVHVLHRVNPYRYDGRRLAGRARTWSSRRRLRWIASTGGAVAVHTPTAAAVVNPFLGPRGAMVVDLVQRSVGTGRPTGRYPAELLFVGNARGDRGLETLLDALRNVPRTPRLSVMGRQHPDTRRLLEARAAGLDVTWDDRFVPDDDVEAAYRRRPLVVLPYRPAFRAAGAASQVLLEAIAHGCPVLATDAIVDQLPVGYRGAVVAPSADAGGLAAGLAEALGRIEELRDAAEAGPRLVAERNAPTRYLHALVSAAEGAARDR